MPNTLKNYWLGLGDSSKLQTIILTIFIFPSNFDPNFFGSKFDDIALAIYGPIYGAQRE
jgi:hypothetical protein